MPVQAFGAVVSAEVVPPDKAPTGFADMRAAFADLDDDTKTLLRGLTAKHSLYYSQGRSGYLPTPNDDGSYEMYGYHDKPVPVRPMVKVHPETGVENLLVGRHAHEVSGLSEDESVALVDRINEAACTDDRVHYHQWEVGDVVVWDNRRLMHCATEFDLSNPRRIWHTRIAGSDETELAENYR
jgi:alpha-ketoglutarate-dependent taurine dioxygenase